MLFCSSSCWKLDLSWILNWRCISTAQKLIVSETQIADESKCVKLIQMTIGSNNMSYWTRCFKDLKINSKHYLRVHEMFWKLIRVLDIRARWEHQFLNLVSRCMYSYVKLNFKADLFSSTFWFERIFISKIELLLFSFFTF